ncbi:carboxylesterase family protein [Pseudomonas sp. gcc21]|uniref:carboxylesterase/lipase family protein n=1 Tax=Pseudomonas sp. gcc21 TaxID=2726989 RepID=UPI0014529CFB|nr:carboxylesterase family protein [Pseudomonas sp. gcc21]QJD58474.1 carboxylesterase family protein [Pseudomonas sp. gcc21]
MASWRARLLLWPFAMPRPEASVIHPNGFSAPLSINLSFILNRDDFYFWLNPYNTLRIIKKMTPTTIKKTSPKFLLSTLSAVVIAASLSGCLSSGGGSSDDDRKETANPLQVSTLQGDYIGIVDNGMRTYRGIRYGVAERFAAPEFPEAHSTPVKLSTDFASNCPQNDSAFGQASVDEDCLFLNVYAPEEPGEYPVMVWIHGGAFVYGSGGESYDPVRLVEKGVVVVTLNYRLGALGFLPHASLGDSNFGLQDQQLALQWVKDNISKFDGDADNVTIFGESAGGHSVMSQLASPGAAGLFHKAIVQSGSYNGNQVPLTDTVLGPVTIPGGQSLFGAPTIADTKCADDTGDQLVSCLRSLSVEDLLKAQPDNILPVTGTDTLPVPINEALASDFNEVPVMMGSNLNEGTLFSLLALAPAEDDPTTAEDESLRPPFVISDIGYYAAVASLLQEDLRLDAATIADDYLNQQTPVAILMQLGLSESDAGALRRYNAYSAIGTDWRFTCPNSEQWDLLTDKVDTWGYWFTDTDAPSILGDTQSPFPLGASHSFEIQYVLSSSETLVERGASEEQVALAEQMAGYWTNFAKYGDNPAIGPNGTDGAEGSIEWPRLTSDGEILRLNTPNPEAVGVADFRTTHQCAYWKTPPLAAQ